jgi:hypothetical protein
MESPPQGFWLGQPLKLRLPVYVPAHADVGVDDLEEAPHAIQSRIGSATIAALSALNMFTFSYVQTFDRTTAHSSTQNKPTKNALTAIADLSAKAYSDHWVRVH